MIEVSQFSFLLLMMNATTMLDTVIDATSMISVVSTFSNSSTEEEVEGPPRVIHFLTSPMERKEAFYSSSSTPYAQLCYDPQQATLVAIMETRRKGRRDILPDSFPSLQATNTVATTSSSSTSQLSNASTFTLSTMTERHVERRESHLPFVLGTHTHYEEVMEEDENCLYLLQDCDVEAAPKTGPGCARALQKFVKSRPLRFLQVHKHQYPRHPLRERTVKHDYEPVQSQTSLQKWV